MSWVWIGYWIVGIASGCLTFYLEYKKQHKIDIVGILACIAIACFGYVNILSFTHYLWLENKIPENWITKIADTVLNIRIYIRKTIK